jgi:hypothetical protein
METSGMTTKDELGIKSAELFSEKRPGGILRQLFVTAAHDMTSGVPGRNYGQHGTDWWFVVSRNGEAAVALRWMFPFRLRRNRRDDESSFTGLGDLSFHSHIRLSEYDSPCDKCQWLSEKECYSSLSSLAAGTIFERFVADPAGLWEALEDHLVSLEVQIAIEKGEVRSGG